jgi:CubicO group peptidase (beta-lactamase class C family)
MKLRFERVGQMCAAAVADGTVPGLVLLVAERGQVAFHQAFGSRQTVPRNLPAFNDTLYDVASLTKAVVTSVLVMGEVAAGRLRLEQRVAEALPEFAAAAEPARGAVTMRHLLCHASGLPAHRPFWRRALQSPSSRLAVATAAAREPLERPPGTQAVYSDLGFILLGWLLERATGERLDVLAERRIVRPLALASTVFLGLAEVDARARVLGERSIAATQICPERGRVLIGEVDDLNAFAMGGIAGHAGLFSTAADLSAIAAALCRSFRGDEAGHSLVERDVVRSFWTPSGVPGSTWRLGWDGPAAGHSQAGARLAREAVGHLAFTGCSLWIDPARETWIVLLSNRVHPRVPTDDRFRRFRPAVHDAALEAIGYAG